jgi:hypothetical protein
MRPILSAIAVLFLAVTPTRADTVYTYTGNAFDEFTGPSCTCSLTGWIQLSQPVRSAYGSALPAVAFSFTSNGVTLDCSNSTLAILNLASDGTGGIALWTVDITGSGGKEFWSQFVGSGAEATVSPPIPART